MEYCNSDASAVEEGFLGGYYSVDNAINQNKEKWQRQELSQIILSMDLALGAFMEQRIGSKSQKNSNIMKTAESSVFRI